MLGLGNSATKFVKAWQPSDESSCQAWWPKNGAFTLNTLAVAKWDDESGNGNHLVQTNDSHQPSAVENGYVTFDGGTSNQHFDTTSQITLANDLTIGMIIDADNVTNRILMGDNTTSNNWFRIADEDTLHMKFDSTSTKGLVLDAGTTFNPLTAIVITKNSSNELYLHMDGVRQTNSVTSGITGQMLIDAIGIRHDHANEYSGTMTEIMIFNSTSASLTANVISHLKSIKG